MNERPTPSRGEETASAGPMTAALLAESRETILRFIERLLGFRNVAKNLVQRAFAQGLTTDGASSVPGVASFRSMVQGEIVETFRRRAATQRREADADAARSNTGEEICGTVGVRVGNLAATLKPEDANALRRGEVEGHVAKNYAVRAGARTPNAFMRPPRSRLTQRRRLLPSRGRSATHCCRLRGSDARN